MKKYIFAHPWLFLSASIASAATQGIFVLVSMLSMQIVDTMTAGDSTAFFSLIIIAVLTIFLYLVGLHIHPRLMTAYNLKTARTIKRDIFNGLISSKISDFRMENSAKYISIINNDVETIETKYIHTIPSLVRDCASLILALTVMVIISPLNALIAAIVAFLPLAIPMVFASKLSDTQLAASTNAIFLNQKTKDYLSGFEVIKTFGVEENIREKFTSSATDYMKARFRAHVTVTDMSAWLVSAMLLARYINYFVAGFFVLRGDISVGAVVALVSLQGNILSPIKLISEHIGNLKAVKSVNQRVLDIMRKNDTTVRLNKISTFGEGIQLNDVNFAYTSDANKESVNKNTALKNINFHFKKGGKYIIVGASGSGKSTLVKLLLGYYDNYEGDILIDKSDLRDLDRSSLYSRVSVLHQDVFLLDDTLRNNITLYNNYSEEEYRNALQKANLIDVESRLPNGSDTMLGESGNTLSGGERQRVSIARTFLKGSEVMILDEATASLDNLIAHDIEKSVVGIEGLTCILVTHRYSKDILEQCDNILVMKNGELFEHGSFSDLYEKRGYFYSLLTAQGF